MVRLFALAPLVAIAIVLLVVLAVRRAAPSGSAEPRDAPAQETRPVTSPPSRLASDLARWVAAGLLSEDQSTAILGYEAGLPATRPETARPAPERACPRRIPAVAEALGYLGGILAITGLVLLVAQYWPEMVTAGRLALSGAGALALLGAGAFVREQADAALARLRWFLWLLSAAATALFARVLAVDAFEVESAEAIVLACSAAVTLHSGLLWWWRDRPLQQFTFLGGLAFLAGSSVALTAYQGPAGLAVWVVGGVYLLLGLRRFTPLPVLTGAVGALAAVVGATMTLSDWPGFGLPFAVATALGLLAIATVPGLAPARADRIVMTVLGGLAAFQAVPSTLGYFGREAAVPTGLVTWAVGAALLLIGARRFVRTPVAAEVAGGLALLGGAAVTAADSPGFATIFGILTAVSLVALGMMPGQVLLSVFGSLGLLVNVPWAIGWFFPGEGRAPLLILVSGALILAVAVLLTRMGGRFRREIRGPRRPHPPRPVPSGVG